MILIKLGGSIITNKQKPLSPRRKTIDNILKEIGSLLDNFSTDYKKIDVFALGVNLYLLRSRIIFDSNDELKSFNYLIKKMIEPHHIKRFSILEVIKYAS